MTFAQTEWHLPGDTPLKVSAETMAEWASHLEVSPLVVELCVRRGLTTEADIQEFLAPTPSLWHDPMRMHDMDKAVDRLQQAIETGEQILIFGDYDADGITSTAILYETLEMLGADVSYYLPNRFTDGYGPNRRVFQEAIDRGVSLIITVDCGIAAHDPIEWAMSQQVDVILSDHHEIPSVIPKAYAVVHPRHPEGDYPFGDLSGAGVAFKIAHALIGELPEELIEIAAIGTVADLVSLTDENRTIVKIGLQQLAQTQRLGLMTLFESLDMKTDQIDEKTIGFQIAPRFNALGRLGEAAPGVQLLTTFDDEEARQIVDFMQSENTRRQQIVDDITTEALEMAQSQKNQPVLVLAQKNWHEGVLGIVASRVVEMLGKPTIILGIQEDGLQAKGSARSCASFNLYDALTACADLLVKFGGHHMAAGLTIDTVMLPALMERLASYAKEHEADLTAATVVEVAQALPISEASVTLIDSLRHLKPYGTDNPEPVFELADVTVQTKQQLGENGQHLKLSLVQDGQSLQAIAFQKGDWADLLNLQSTISVLGTLMINEWQGNRLPQLMLKDIAVDGALIFDWRTTKIRKEHLSLERAVYLVERENLQPLVKERIPESSLVMTMAEWVERHEALAGYDSLVLFDCPVSKVVTEQFRQVPVTQKLYIIAYTPKSVMTTGLPNRDKFKQVYQYLKTHQQVPYDKTTGNVATYLKIPLEQFKIILKVFFELEFVIINDGFLQLNAHPTSGDLMAAPLMQSLKEQQWLEKVFIYSQFQELSNWLTQQN